MGTLLDAYALVAFLAAEPAGADVRRLVDAGDAAISTVNLVEAADLLQRLGGIGGEEVRGLVDALPLPVIPFTMSHAWRAAELRARYYHRRESALSLADCCLIAVATPADRVATADPSVLRMAEAEGIATVALRAP